MPELSPEALIRRRRNALLAKWASGKRLSPQELAEVGPHLPQPAPCLVLEAQVEGHSEKMYREGREAYAARYAQSVRTINRWMGQKAPLDDAAAMVDWWPTCHKHRVPDELLVLARAAAAPPAADPLRLALPAGAAPGAAALLPAVELSPVDQARTLLNTTYAELIQAQAVAAADPARLTRAQRAYALASEQLRRVQLADPKIRAAAGAVVDRALVRTVVSALHTSLAASLRSFLKRVRRELSGKEPAEQDAIWQEKCDELFSRFRDCDFADPA